MCDPVTALAMTSMAMQVGGGIADYQAQSAQAEMQSQMHALNKHNALESMRLGYETAGKQQQQEGAAAADQKMDRRIQMWRDMGSARASNAESGVTGFSMNRILRDTGAVASRDFANIDQNRDWSMGQVQDQKRGLKNETRTRIDSMSKGTKPSAWGSVFRVGGGLAQTGMQYHSMKS